MKVKRLGWILVIVIFFGAGVLILPRLAPAASLAGNILLQVQSRGEAWYVYPGDGQRYYLKDGATAFALMRSLGLGISESDYNKLAAGNTALRASVKGRIVLRVQARGEAYFLCPRTGILSYLRDGAAAYSVMRQCGLGITNADLARVAISKNSASPSTASAISSGCAYNNPSCDSSNQCINNKCTPKDGCAYGNPSCGNPKICVNNVCVDNPPASGCNYGNPVCDSSHTCQNNECILLSGCNYGNPSCDATNICQNNSCVLRSGCDYGNPACYSTQDCINNTCVDKEVACVTPACLADHQAQAYTGSTSGTGSYLLAPGQTKEILPNIFVRAENDTIGSIWVKNNGVCLIKRTLPPQGGFVVGDKLVAMNKESGSLRFNVYAGYDAYNKCEQLNPDSHGIAFCEGLPHPDSYIMTGKMFTRVFDGTQYAPAQSISVDMDDIAYNKDISVYPAIADTELFGSKLQITDIKSSVMPSGYAGMTDVESVLVSDDYAIPNTSDNYLIHYSANSADYQRAMNFINSSDTSSITLSPGLLVWGPFMAETHEFTHGLFGNTALENFFPNIYGSMLVEGWGNYIGNIGNTSIAERSSFADLHCGKTQFLNAPNPALNYSDIISSNPYAVGECFFSKVEKICGTATINSFIDKIFTEPAAPQNNWPHPIEILENGCPDKVAFQAMLNDLGLKESLISNPAPLVPGLLPGNACSAQ